jgi:hypothetical protein
VSEIFITIHRKLAGVIFFNHRPIDYALKDRSKTSHESKYEMRTFDAIYPEKIDIPEYYELLNRDEFPEHDHIRLELLQWIVGGSNLMTIQLKSIPKDLFIEIVALTIMVKNGIATIKEADIFLLTLYRKKMPFDQRGRIEKYPFPEVLDPRAFRLALLFNESRFVAANICKVSGLCEKCNVS